MNQQHTTRNSYVLILNTASATTKDLTNGTAVFNLRDQLRFAGTKPKLALNSFSYTNFFLNVSAALANNTIYYSDNALIPTKYSITIPDGSYSVATLNSFVSNQLASDAVAPALFTIEGDSSTNKVYLKFGALTGWYLSFQAGTPYTLLGFDLNDFAPASKSNTASEIVFAPNIAAFNNIESVNVKTNLSNNFILGTAKSPVIYQSTPNVSPGSVQKDEPNNLMWSDSNALSCGIAEIRLSLTDQNDTPLPMTENFSVTLQISVDE